MLSDAPHVRARAGHSTAGASLSANPGQRTHDNSLLQKQVRADAVQASAMPEVTERDRHGHDAREVAGRAAEVRARAQQLVPCVGERRRGSAAQGLSLRRDAMQGDAVQLGDATQDVAIQELSTTVQDAAHEATPPVDASQIHTLPGSIMRVGAVQILSLRVQGVPSSATQYDGAMQGPAMQSGIMRAHTLQAEGVEQSDAMQARPTAVQVAGMECDIAVCDATLLRTPAELVPAHSDRSPSITGWGAFLSAGSVGSSGRMGGGPARPRALWHISALGTGPMGTAEGEDGLTAATTPGHERPMGAPPATPKSVQSVTLRIAQRAGGVQGPAMQCNTTHAVAMHAYSSAELADGAMPAGAERDAAEREIQIQVDRDAAVRTIAMHGGAMRVRHNTALPSPAARSESPQAELECHKPVRDNAAAASAGAGPPDAGRQPSAQRIDKQQRDNAVQETSLRCNAMRAGAVQFGEDTQDIAPQTPSTMVQDAVRDAAAQAEAATVRTVQCSIMRAGALQMSYDAAHEAPTSARSAACGAGQHAGAAQGHCSAVQYHAC